jgi:hypothetical protein
MAMPVTSKLDEGRPGSQSRLLGAFSAQDLREPPDQPDNR